MSDFRDLITSATRQARADGQASTLAHLGHAALRLGRWRDEPAVRAVAAAVAADILRKPPVKLTHVHPTKFDITYAVEAAEQDFDAFAAARKARGPLYEEVLDWVLTGTFADEGTRDRFRAACDRPEFRVALAGEARPGAAALGTAVTADWLHAATATPLLTAERQTDLADHAQFLAQSGKTRTPYLLVGGPGVGKSLFVRHLLRRAAGDWAAGANPTLKATRFLFFGDSDFVGSEADIDGRLKALYEHLSGHAAVVPVIDGFELFPNDALGLGRLFTSYFGAMIGGRRTFALVCRTAPASTAPLLRGVHPSPLLALSPDACQPIFLRGLEGSVRVAGVPVEVEGGPDTFCRELAALVAER
jgi:hypothetical protein